MADENKQVIENENKNDEILEEYRNSILAQSQKREKLIDVLLGLPDFEKFLDFYCKLNDLSLNTLENAAKKCTVIVLNYGTKEEAGKALKEVL